MSHLNATPFSRWLLPNVNLLVLIFQSCNYSSSSSFLACNSRLRCAVRRPHPPQRPVLGHIHCFRQCEIVGSQILLYGAQPCDAGESSWIPPVLWRESWQDPLGIYVIVHIRNMPKKVRRRDCSNYTCPITCNYCNEYNRFKTIVIIISINGTDRLVPHHWNLQWTVNVSRHKRLYTYDLITKISVRLKWCNLLLFKTTLFLCLLMAHYTYKVTVTLIMHNRTKNTMPGFKLR